MAQVYSKTQTDTLLASKADASALAGKAAAADVAKVASDVAATSKLAAGYVAQTIAAPTTITVAAGTYDLSVSTDATLTLTAPNGTVVTLIVRPATGETLTIAGTNTVGGTAAATAISTIGVYTLLKLPEGWVVGGSGSASSPGGSTSPGTGTLPPAGSVTEVARLDLSTVADGTKIDGLMMTNSTAVSADSYFVAQNKKIAVPTSQGGWVGGAVRGGVSLVKELISVDYDLAGGWGMGNAALSVMAAEVGGYAGFMLNGDASVGWSANTNTTWSSTVDDTAVIAKSGTASLLFDSKNATLTFVVNGKTLGTASSTTIDKTKRASGFMLMFQGNGGASVGTLSNLVVSSVV